MGVDLSGYLRPLAWATLVANIVIVVTGGAVRLTKSGLGCPTWPECSNGSLTPHGELGIHGAIEFGNRLLTYVLLAIAVALVVAVWQSGRRDLRRLALILLAGIPAQGVIGGVTVLTDLNPWVVAFHLLCSMAMIGLSVWLLRRARFPAVPTASGPALWLAWANFAAAWLVLYAGTVVTGAGPHAGDEDAPRNGLSPLQMSQLHADLVFLLIGLTIGLIFVGLAVHAPRATVRAGLVLLIVEAAQSLIGFVQYFTDLPIVLVGFHMLGAAVISATVTWVLLRVRHPA